MTLYWEDQPMHFRIKGYISSNFSLNAWEYTIYYGTQMNEVEVWENSGWRTLARFDSVADAKHFCEMYEATGARV